jgi:hypothetical protein
MNKTSELSLCAGELRNVAQSLNALADSITALFSGKGDETESTPKAAVVPPKPQPEPKPLTLAQVRAVLAEKSRDGHTTEVRALLEAHGVTKLSEVDPSKYPALLAAAEAFGSE